MAIGKSYVPTNLDKLSIKLGDLIVVQWKLSVNYNEQDASEYMKNSDIEIMVDISNGSKILQHILWILQKIYRD